MSTLIFSQLEETSRDPVRIVNHLDILDQPTGDDREEEEEEDRDL